MGYEYAKYKKTASKNKISQANNNSSRLEIILPSFYDYFNPIGVKQSTKTSFENLAEMREVVWLGMCYGRRFDRHN